ncbi:WD40/YVTN/BNR-like repeat-containing protein [Phycicoccus sonneratiae]|uniref:Oxidoreductase n=1 Tax=Phycicoccus sonneratiae TaxID=2807628 RepID=A0ABS2CP16_9MICO|nr:oxidoreductase [Phycicoccus sonneraticus]MBM6401530.1 oxidoreductase [Phycicoccus sonneraticus]
MRAILRTVLTTVSAAALVAGPVALAAPAGADGHHDRGHTPRFTTRVLDPDQSFRGLDAVDARTAWVSGGSITEGGAGGVWRTTDGGAHWQDVSPPQTTGLNFRDVEARSATEASILSIGPGEDSRILRTTDGGRTWTETFRNTEPTAFYNCLAFFPGGRHGLAVSDPVDGHFRIAATDDGGRSWRVLPSRGMPEADGEANFSASGECLTVSGHDAWFGSGGERSRVFHSTDLGRTWRAAPSRIPPGEAAGVFALAFRTPHQGIAVGGDFAAPDDGADAVSTTRDGRTWRGAGDLEHLGEDVTWLPGTRSAVLVVGESGEVGGVSVSPDGGHHWVRLSDTGFHTLDCTADGSCWAAGGAGGVARASVR